MRALITGASNGIGRELAHCFAADHHDLVITARSDQRLEELAAELRLKYSIEVEVLVADLSTPNAAKDILAALNQRAISISYLINNAGFGVYGPFQTNNLADELQELQLNIVALTELTHLFLPGMLERKNGRILNVASTAAFQPGPFLATYSATKAYVLSFSEALGYELRGTGVTVTCLCPGPTATGFGERSGFTMDPKFAAKIPSAGEVARFGYEAMFTGQPVAVHGVSNRLLTLGTKIAPRSVVTQVSGKILAASKARSSQTPTAS